MEYCLSILYVAMDELGMIWCMDAFMERRYKDWKFWVTFTISMAVSFYLFNFVVSGITVLHILIAYGLRRKQSDSGKGTTWRYIVLCHT